MEADERVQERQDLLKQVVEWKAQCVSLQGDRTSLEEALIEAKEEKLQVMHTPTLWPSSCCMHVNCGGLIGAG